MKSWLLNDTILMMVDEIISTKLGRISSPTNALNNQLYTLNGSYIPYIPYIPVINI